MEYCWTTESWQNKLAYYFIKMLVFYFVGTQMVNTLCFIYIQV
jgi:hypothetical protein